MNSESHHADGCKTAAFLSKELQGGRRKRRVYMEECENLSDWEDEPLLPTSIRNSQDERSVFMQTDEWL